MSLIIIIKSKPHPPVLELTNNSQVGQDSFLTTVHFKKFEDTKGLTLQ